MTRVIWRILKWSGIAVLAVLVVVAGSVLSAVTGDVMHIVWNIGDGSSAGGAGYLFGAFVGYFIGREGWL